MEFTAKTLLEDLAEALSGANPLVAPICHHGPLERLKPITEIKELRSALSVMEVWDGAPNSARAWSPPGISPFELLPERGNLITLYNAGFTIVLENVESYVPALRPLCRALESDLGVAPGRINAEVFCALKGGAGRAHFDSSFTFNCQISGTKAWMLAQNPALDYPPRGIGMFLGRPIPAELEAFLTDSMPDNIENPDHFLAQPGSVVFLPPGVLHQTYMETESFAVAFAIEETDCVASHVSQYVFNQLKSYPLLRAPRLGAQTVVLARERAMVVKELRKYADLLDNGSPMWATETKHYKLPEGLAIISGIDLEITLVTPLKKRTLTVAHDLKSVLVWGAKRSSFSLADVMREVELDDPYLAPQCLAQLTRTGLLEVITSQS